jgi:hypothetical protein
MWPSSCFNSLSFISLLFQAFPCLIIRTQPVCFSSDPPCYTWTCTFIISLVLKCIFKFTW